MKMKDLERNKEFIDFDYLYKRDYIIRHLLDYDLYICLYDAKRLRRLMNSIYKILREVEDENKKDY